MFTFNISSAVLLSVALLLSEKKLQVEADECSYNSDCGNNKYCCKQQYSWQGHVCRYGGCVGQSCYWNRDCGGPGECCNYSNYCTRSGCYKTATRSPYGCSYNSDCDKNKYCCKQRYTWQTSVCSYGGCVGRSCRRDSDCGGPGECCSSFTNFCAESHNCDHHVTKALDSWLIVVIVVSVLVVVVILIAIVVCCYRGRTSAWRGRSQQGVVVNQQNGETVVNLQNCQNTQTAQDNPEQLQMPPPPDHFNKGY